MAGFESTFGSRFATDTIEAERSQQLIARALGVLSARGARRLRLAIWALLAIAAASALWAGEFIPLGLTMLVAASTLAGREHRISDRVVLVLALQLAAALVSFELRAAGSTRFLFFIATALSVAYSEVILVWTGAVVGVAAQVVATVLTPTPAMGTAVGLALFALGGLLFTLVAADWASSMRRRVVRSARRRWILEERQRETGQRLSRAQLTERRLVDMAANLREAQDVLKRDVQKRKDMADQLALAMVRAEDANKAKSAFLARMSHELRTPLNSVIGFSSLLLRTTRARLEDKELGFLERIKSNGAHLLTLINDILDLSKIEAGRMQVEVMPVPLGALIRDCVAMLEPQARPGVQLLVDLPPEEHTVSTDGARLRQVVINLAGNALKFTATGSVTVALRLSALGVPDRLEVIDTGIGIPAERQAAIFEPFEQGDNSTARSHGGTGLGLAICRQLCALMGMHLTLTSAPGTGSTFSVVFYPESPSALEPAAMPAARGAAPRPERTARSASEVQV